MEGDRYNTFQYFPFQGSFRVDVHNQKQLNLVCKAVAFLVSGALMHPAFNFHWQIESPWNKHMQYGPLCNIYFKGLHATFLCEMCVYITKINKSPGPLQR